MSAYEQLRMQNIKRNEEIMRMLGLDQHDLALHRATHGSGTNKAKSSKPGNNQQKARGGGRKRKSAASGEASDSRKALRRSSRRLAGKGAESGGIEGDGDEPVVGASAEREQAPLRAGEEEHELAEAEHLRWAGKQKKASVVGTASYKHTLMRVRTMNEAALGRRIKAIERACGQVGLCVRNCSTACRDAMHVGEAEEWGFGRATGTTPHTLSSAWSLLCTLLASPACRREDAALRPSSLPGGVRGSC